MEKLLNIQALRAIAALFVVVLHCGLEMTRLAASFGREPFYDYGRWNAGISLFFTISGFIMVVTCHDAFGRPGEALRFMRRRLARIAPIYWLLTLLVAIIALAAPRIMPLSIDDPLSIPYSILFWPFARASGEIRPLVTPGWTLNLEAYFYCVFACGLLFRRAIGLSLIIAVIAGLSALNMNGALSGVPLTFWGDPIVFGFLFGMGVGLAYQRGWRLPPPAAFLLIGIGFLISFTGGVREPPEDAFLARLSNSLPATLILIGAALGPQVDRASLGWPFAWRPLVIIGDASYSLYLVHEFLLRPLRLIWEKAIGDTLPLGLFVATGLMLSIAAGILSYRWLELPMGRWLQRRDRAARSSIPRSGLSGVRRF